MGIGIQEINFLDFIHSKIGAFKSVATIGRQALILDNNQISRLIDKSSINTKYCEDLLSIRYGATEVDSYDANNYEKATYIANFNNKNSFEKKYDLVLDFGSLEHIFNTQQAFLNVATLCKKNGFIAHANPSNLFCGHGFYQFSPELYYSLYSKKNGFEDTVVFLANYQNIKNYWYLAHKPKEGNRSDFLSFNQLGALVFTKKIEIKEKFDVEQSDYSFVYTKKTEKKIYLKSKYKFITNFLKKIPTIKSLIKFYGLIKYHFIKKKIISKKFINKNESFTKFYFKSFL